MRHSLIASFVVVLAVPALAAPALARPHAHGYRQIAYRHVAYHHVARRPVVSMQAKNFGRGVFGQGFYDYAPAMPTRQSRQNDWQQSGWGANNVEPSHWSQGGFGQSGSGRYGELDGMAAAQASLNGVPVSLVERVIKRESGGNPRAVSRGNYGLMQIRLGTARAMGFSGSAAELLDPAVNMTYAVRYLAGAYRAANGNENRAVALYASGYYYQAKAQGFSPYAPEASGFAAYQPGGIQTAEAFGNPAPVYRVRHRRHRAV
jgi:soluble lytic murein transglycosylase-like protein